jgi:enamine deaminase RidA (YjgF/YER057c/UK114 family)
MTIFQPAGWPPPRGYSNGISARGRQVFVAGMIGWDQHRRFEGDDFVAQARQAPQNIVAVLAQDGAKPEHTTRMTWYVTSRREYLESGKALVTDYREVIGRHFPVMTAVEVSALMEERAKVEIEVTAVVPD